MSITPIRLFSTRRGRVLVSIVMSCLMIGIYTCCVYKTGTASDDYGIANQLSGYYEENTSCLFINSLLGRITIFLNSYIHGPNWFYLIEWIAVVISLGLVSYCVVTYLEPKAMITFMASVYFVILPYCIGNTNFTFVSAFASMSGMVLIVLAAVQFGKTDRISRMLVVGCILWVIGYAYRSQCALMTLPFLAVSFMYQFLFYWRIVKSKRMYMVKGLLLPVGIIGVLISTLIFCDYLEVQNEDYSKWVDYNAARSVISDYPNAEWGEVAGTLEPLGISANDYWMATHWATADTDVFDEQTLREIASVQNNEYTDGVKGVLKAIRDGFVSYSSRMMTTLGFFTIVILVGCVALLFSNRKRCIAIVCLIGFSLALCSYFSGVGRLPERVELPIWWFSLCGISLLFVAEDDQNVWSKTASLKGVLNALANRIVIIDVLLLILIFAVSIPHLQLPRIFKDANGYETNSKLVNYMIENEDDVFLFDTSTGFAIPDAYEQYYFPDKQLTNRLFYAGGWGINSPTTNSSLKEAGIDNIVKNMAERDNIFYISGKQECLDHLLVFIQEHYYPDATYQKVDIIDGFPIYKFESNAT